MATVLLVEDEPIIRMGIADYIRSQGYAVVEAGTGDRAIQIIQSGELIDLIVTDVQMPGKHDGIALALWARKSFPRIKLIIVSGATSGSELLDPLGHEGRIMPKPYPYEAVVSRIADLLRGAGHAHSKSAHPAEI